MILCDNCKSEDDSIAVVIVSIAIGTQHQILKRDLHLCEGCRKFLAESIDKWLYDFKNRIQVKRH